MNENTDVLLFVSVLIILAVFVRVTIRESRVRTWTDHLSEILQLNLGIKVEYLPGGLFFICKKDNEVIEECLGEVILYCVNVHWEKISEPIKVLVPRLMLRDLEEGRNHIILYREDTNEIEFGVASEENTKRVGSEFIEGSFDQSYISYAKEAMARLGY